MLEQLLRMSARVQASHRLLPYFNPGPQQASVTPGSSHRLVVKSQAAAQAQGMEPGRHSLSVAVVGGGAAGLATCRELLRAGHRPTVLERSHNIGGVWDYSDETEDHPLGLGQRHVHGSMYAQLRTNLPREVMGFGDFPFDTGFKGSTDPRQFCSHQEVQRYLEAFAAEFELLRHVRFGTEVQSVEPVKAPAGSAAAGSAAAGNSSNANSDSHAPATPGGRSNGASSDSGTGSLAHPQWLRWEVTTRPAAQQREQEQAASPTATSNGSGSGGSRQQYDAVVVCNGHYSRPRLPHFPGQAAFPGLQMHSHNYRRPEPFRGQRVVLLGASSSGVDIAEELLNAGAKEVILCARVWENPLTGEVLEDSSSSSSTNSSSSSQADAGGAGGSPAGAAAALRGGIVKAGNLRELHADGAVTLADGRRIEGVDVVMYCTGYLYDFPFLAGTGLVSVEDSRVGPALYQHIFPPAAAPTLAFVGLPWKVVPFPQFELQSRWIASVLAGTAALPSPQEMERQAAEFYADLAAAGTPVRYTHRMSGSTQWQYNRWLQQQCGGTGAQDFDWREALYNASGMSRKQNAERYRDAPLPAAAEAAAAAQQEAAHVRQRRAAAALAAATS